jgi:hypothetical protein
VIREVSELIRAFAAEERKKLDALGITHPPTIGEMYEALTAGMMEKAIPPELDLRVTNGFITATEGYTPDTGQIDCMLVRGEGKPIGKTGRHIWHVRDVIAVLEVKKSMFTGDLEDSFEQLRGVADAYDKWVGAGGTRLVDTRPARLAFAEITGDIAPERALIDTLPPLQQMIYHSLVVEQDAPIRIALGFDGFSSEYGLRKGFINLMIARAACLIKLNGQPYAAQIDSKWWPVLASAKADPVRIMLELIWTRLAREFPAVDDWFDDDLRVEVLAPLLKAKIELGEDDRPVGWSYEYFDFKGKELNSRAADAEWEPAELTGAEHAVYQRLLGEGSIDTAAAAFLSFAADHGGADALIASLIRTGLVARSGSQLRPTTVEARSMILPDGRYIAGEDSSGRLARWLTRYMERRRREREILAVAQ